MPGVAGRQVLAAEDMAQVAPAGGAGDLGPPAVRIGRVFNPPLNLLVEARPAAAGIEFIG